MQTALSHQMIFSFQPYVDVLSEGRCSAPETPVSSIHEPLIRITEKLLSTPLSILWNILIYAKLNVNRCKIRDARFGKYLRPESRGFPQVLRPQIHQRTRKQDQVSS